MKILFIVIDGLSDEEIPSFGWKTPLEAAKTPHFDLLARNGVCGLVLPWVKKGSLPTSEDSHLALFGYNPEISNPGRGVLEVLGIGEKILPGDVCLRGNFATLDENFKIVDRRAGRIENTQSLIKALNKIKINGLTFLIKKAFSHRIGIVIRGENLSPKISSNDPKIVGVKPLRILAREKSKRAIFTAKILNEFLTKAHFILKNHPLNKKRERLGLPPANYLLVRGAGSLRKVLSFQEKYRLKAGYIAGGTLYKGIGRFLGMKEIKVKGANGLVNTNLKGKFLAAKNSLKNYNFVFLHIKATDNLAEDGNFLGKKEFIEKIDKNLSLLLKLKEGLIIITADHSTCSLSKNHCKIPVPILIYKTKEKKLTPSTYSLFKKENKLMGFSERECQKGELGKIKQINVMKIVLKYARGIC